jgi:transposase
MMPVARTGALIGDFFGLPMSDGAVWAANEEAQTLLQEPVAAIGRALQEAPVAHADETGARVAGQLQWLHVLATATLTWIGCHPNRGQKAFEAFGLLTGFLGTLIHDGGKPYRELRCQQGLCNAHHLRELTYLFEEMSQVWAKRLIDWLTETCHEVHAAKGILSPERRDHILGLYADILGEGEAANPRAPPSGRRGRSKQSKATNWLARLRL